MTTRELVAHLEALIAKGPGFADAQVMFVIEPEDDNDAWYTTTDVSVLPAFDVLPWESGESELFVKIEGRDGNTQDEDDE